MIDYSNMPDGNPLPRRCGWVAAALYCLVVIVSFTLVRCESRAEEVDDASSGSLVISFGDVAESSGETIKSVQEAVQPPAPEPQPEPEPQQTDERSDVEVPPVERVVEQPVEQPKPQEVKPEVVAEELVEAKPREVNRRALFPGTSEKRESPGEGESKELPSKGVAGSDRGTPGVRGKLGEGLTGDYSLAGRSLIGALPVPSYTAQAEGRVVIAIVVDEKGRVTSAGFQLANSTTNDSRLVNAAREAALKARFDQSEEFVQGGTITYVFKMN